MLHSKPFAISKVFNFKEIFFFFLVCIAISIFIYLDNLSQKRIEKPEKETVSMEKSSLEKNLTFQQEKKLSDKEILEKKLNALLQEKKFTQAKTFIKEIMPQVLRDKKLKEFLIEKAMVAGDKKFSLELAIEIANKTKDKEDIKKAIKMCLWAQNYNLAKQLIRKYATNFPEDYEFNNFILKSALAVGDPFFAAEIAEKLSKKVGVLL